MDECFIILFQRVRGGVDKNLNMPFNSVYLILKCQLFVRKEYTLFKYLHYNC